MITRYRLPESLGGCEATVVEVDPALQLGGFPAHVLRTDTGTWLVAQQRDLTEVKPPLPPEPPHGAIVHVQHPHGGFVAERDDHAPNTTPPNYWWTTNEAGPIDWTDLASGAERITKLVPDPFAEPVALPWSEKSSFGTPLTVHTNGVHSVSVVVGGSIAGLTRNVAREFARAIWWAAADAVEAAVVEELPEWERELLEGQR